jgi:hypothetical protein
MFVSLHWILSASHAVGGTYERMMLMENPVGRMRLRLQGAGGRAGFYNYKKTYIFPLSLLASSHQVKLKLVDN